MPSSNVIWPEVARARSARDRERGGGSDELQRCCGRMCFRRMGQAGHHSATGFRRCPTRPSAIHRSPSSTSALPRPHSRRTAAPRRMTSGCGARPRVPRRSRTMTASRTSTCSCPARRTGPSGTRRSCRTCACTRSCTPPTDRFRGRCHSAPPRLDCTRAPPPSTAVTYARLTLSVGVSAANHGPRPTRVTTCPLWWGSPAVAVGRCRWRACLLARTRAVGGACVRLLRASGPSSEASHRCQLCLQRSSVYGPQHYRGGSVGTAQPTPQQHHA